MGFKISWIGFSGIGKADVLSRLGLAESGQIEEVPESPFSGIEIPGGWYVVFANDFLFVNNFESEPPAKLGGYSRECRLVACQVHEGVMTSVAYGYDRGRPIWRIMHDAQQGIYDFTVSGTPPAEFEAIRARLTEEQDSKGGKSSDVDYIFDVPVEVAYALTGFRHDMWRYDWGNPVFMRLEPAR